MPAMGQRLQMYHARHALTVRRGFLVLTAQVCTTLQTHPNRHTETPLATRVARKKFFISYSHAHEAWFKELQTRLGPLRRVYGFKVWHDKHPQAGHNRHAEIQKALGETQLARSADDGEESTLLLLLSEGAEDNLICEIAANDELHPDLKFDRQTIRMLIDEYDLVEPEYRGDRLWKDLGPIEEGDAVAVAEVLAALLEEGFGVPNEDLDVVSNIYAV